MREPDYTSAERGEPQTLRFTLSDESLFDVRARLLSARAELIEIEALSPDHGDGAYFDGELIEIEGRYTRYRSYQAWCDLAQSIGYHLLTPEVSAARHPYITLRLRATRAQADWHATSLPSGDPEKYGAESDFVRIQKAEEAYFLKHLLESLSWVGLTGETRVLSLGVNAGDELALALASLSASEREKIRPGQWVGVDHSQSAIELARERHPAPALTWRVADLRALDDLSLGKFDLIICLNTLQSALLDEQEEVKRWARGHLSPRGSLILSFPNSRYVGTHHVYGDFQMSAHKPTPSKLLKTIAGLQRYLHQHRFVTQVKGKYTMFLNARRR